MKKILILIFACLALTVQAQESFSLVKIGVLSYTKALEALPDYAVTQQRLADLRAQYEKELKRVEDDFNRKYEEFLDGQKDFPKTILLKRQTELRELMERNVAFKVNSRRELAEAEAAALLPLKEQLNDVLAKVAAENGLILIVNIDGDACPFIAPSLKVDAMPLVIEKLRVKN